MSMYYFWKLIKLFSLELKIHPLAKIALNRRKNFKSHSEIFTVYRRKKILSKLSDEYLNIGDLNEDGVLNILDVVLLVNLILSGEK